MSRQRHNVRMTGATTLGSQEQLVLNPTQAGIRCILVQMRDDISTINVRIHQLLTSGIGIRCLSILQDHFQRTSNPPTHMPVLILALGWFWFRIFHSWCKLASVVGSGECWLYYSSYLIKKFNFFVRILNFYYFHICQ